MHGVPSYILQMMEQSKGKQQKIIEIWLDDGCIRVDSDLGNAVITAGVLNFAEYVVAAREVERRAKASDSN